MSGTKAVAGATGPCPTERRPRRSTRSRPRSGRRSRSAPAGEASLRRAAAAVEAPGRGQDLVGAAGARGRVHGAEVAARLAHHDRLRDRPVPEPAGDGLLRLRGGDLLRLLDLLPPSSPPGTEGSRAPPPARRGPARAAPPVPRPWRERRRSASRARRDPLIEGRRLGASLLHLGELRRRPGRGAARTRAASAASASSIRPRSSARLARSSNPLGVQEQLGRVRRVALVDRHEAGRERLQGAAQAGAGLGELRRGLAGLASRAGPRAPGLRPARRRARLSRGGGGGLGAGGGELRRCWRRSRRQGSAPATARKRSWRSARRRSGRRLRRPAARSPRPRPAPTTPQRRRRRAAARGLAAACQVSTAPSFTACGVS